MNTPKVSVVIPCYNVEKYLRQCLDSVINQTLKELEIICVNDGSTDSTLSIIEEYAKNDERVKIIDKPNSGYGNSMNRGFDMATGEYIGIVESDDFIDADMYEHLYTAAVSNNAEVVKSNFYLYWSALGGEDKFDDVLPYELCGKVFCPKTDLKGMDQVNFWNAKPSIWSSIYNREFIRNNSIRFNETPGASYQDASFAFKVWTCAQRVFGVYAAYLHYRQDNEASSVNNPGKVYCICDEYAEMERFINEDASRAKLYPLMNRIRYDSYMWNMSRIAPEFVPEFAKRMADDFNEAAKRGGINKLMFQPWKWDTLKQITTSPADFAAQYIREKQFSAIGEKIDELSEDIDAQNAKLDYIMANQHMGFFAKLFKKMRSGLFILRHQGIRSFLRAFKARLRR